MTKKLSAIHNRFSPAAKATRAAVKEAEKKSAAKEEALYQEQLSQTILSPEFVELAKNNTMLFTQVVYWDGWPIAWVDCKNNHIEVNFLGEHRTEVHISNVDVCKDLLTYGAIYAACQVPNGTSNLARKVRQRLADAEAEQIADVVHLGRTNSRSVAWL